MKGYTDLEQSKKLAEILPLESADMYYISGDDCDICFGNGVYEEIADWLSDGTPRPADIPCWSLAALLGVLPMIGKGEDTANPFIAKAPNGEYYIVYATLTEEVDSSAIYDNPIDACVEMIIKLKERDLL